MNQQYQEPPLLHKVIAVTILVSVILGWRCGRAHFERGNWRCGIPGLACRKAP